MTSQAEQFQKRLILTAKGKRGAKDMSREEAREALDFLVSTDATDIQRAAFVTAMRFKGTIDVETTGFLDAIRANSIALHIDDPHLVNSAGAYDGRAKSLHLVCAAYLTAVAAGIKIITHSSTGLPPKMGMTTGDILEGLKIPINLEPKAVETMVQKTGFGFIHSSKFAYGIEKFRSVREQIRYRTFINSCEPMNNPAGAAKMILGAAHTHFLDKLATAAEAAGASHVIAVKGVEGSDEIATQKAVVFERYHGETRKLDFSAETHGFPAEAYSPILSVGETAETIFDALDNRSDKHHPAIILNAAIRIYLGGKAQSAEAAVQQATEALKSGQAMALLNQLQEYDAD